MPGHGRRISAAFGKVRFFGRSAGCGCGKRAASAAHGVTEKSVNKRKFMHEGNDKKLYQNRMDKTPVSVSDGRIRKGKA